MDPEKYLIPRRLDDPPQLYLWDADEVVVVVFFAILGALLVDGYGLFGGLTIGILLARELARLKDEGGRQTLIGFLYWHTPSDWWFRGRAHSHVREYVGV